MNKSLSRPIKTASLFFLIGGILNLIKGATNLINYTAPVDPESMQTLVYQTAQLISIALGILSLLISWFLMKSKRWAYILGLVFVIISLATHFLVLSQYGTTKWYGFALSATILILLIVGGKTFKKK